MNELIINGVAIKYVLSIRNRKSLSFKARDGILYISAPPYLSFITIENTLKQLGPKIVELVKDSICEKVIHYQGIAYEPLFYLGQPGVHIEGNQIHISARTNDQKAFKKSLHNFYLQALQEELIKIIDQAHLDFKEINFPSIRFKYMKSMFGNYYRKTNTINLSIILAKYDFKYLKNVLYHELTHVLVFDHSKAFYALYEEKYPNARAVQKRLKSIHFRDLL